MDRGQISIQYINRGKAKRRLFVAETKRSSHTDLQVVKFAQVVFVTNRSNYTGRLACLYCESLPRKRPGSMFLVERAHFLKMFFKNMDVEGLTPP